MAKSKLIQINRKIADSVVDGYKAIESGVVGGYKAIENGVVGGYKAIENGVVDGFMKMTDKFADKFLTRDTENAADVKSDSQADESSYNISFQERCQL